MSETDPFGAPSAAQLAAKATGGQTTPAPVPAESVEATEPVAVDEGTPDDE